MRQEKDKAYQQHYSSLNHLKVSILYILTGVFIFFGFSVEAIFAAAPSTSQQPNSSNSEKAISKLQSLLDDKSYFYKREGRHDPFFPFITEETIKAEQEKEEVLTGMRRFEPGQLSLVAIVFAGQEPVAMVEDSIGKGYTIKKGTEIGRAGFVEDILPNKVLIKQEVTSFSKNKKYKTIEMILRKEGEQK